MSDPKEPPKALTVEEVAREIHTWRYSEQRIAEMIRSLCQSIRDEDVATCRTFYDAEYAAQAIESKKL